VNDTYGHAVGDQVLSAVGSRILAALRTGDIAARWGGEEILVALPGAGSDAGVRRAETLRRTIAGAPVRTDAGPLDVTASIGVAVLDGDLDVQRVVADADAALYEAKHGGRNRVVACETTDTVAVPAPSPR
jgi:diguanylate cyclase (GGDEF)-like protein